MSAMTNFSGKGSCAQISEVMQVENPCSARTCAVAYIVAPQRGAIEVARVAADHTGYRLEQILMTKFLLADLEPCALSAPLRIKHVLAWCNRLKKRHSAPL